MCIVKAPKAPPQKSQSQLEAEATADQKREEKTERIKERKRIGSRTGFRAFLGNPFSNGGAPSTLGGNPRPTSAGPTLS